MTVNLRRAKPDDIDELLTMDFRNFGVDILPKEAGLPDDLLDPDRFLVAMDGDQMVAAGGSYQVELTLPGFNTLPTSGVTWVSVLASHRRQGILRSLMSGLDEMATEFEEPVLGLTASEGPIYQRFGYGITTQRRVIEVDRRRTGIRPGLEPERVRLVEAEPHLDEIQAIFDRYRVTQVGEISRTEPLMREHNIRSKKPNYAAIHPDGYAVWSATPHWHAGHPAHEVWVTDLVAVTPEAHLALWNLLLSLDLVGPIKSYGAVALDDLLPSILTDQRALRTTDLNDGLWVKVLDAETSFAARSYRAEDRLVIGITEEPWVTGGDTPALSEKIVVSNDAVTRTDDQPDLIVSRSALGPMLLGTAPTLLADQGIVTADQADLTRADLFFGETRRAHCRTEF